MTLLIVLVVIAVVGIIIAFATGNAWWFVPTLVCGGLAIGIGNLSAPAQPVALPLRPIFSIMYAVDLRAVAGGVMVCVVLDDNQPYYVNFPNATLRVVDGPPQVLLSRRTPNRWWQGGTPHYGPPEVRVPVGTVFTMDRTPPLDRGKLLY